MTITNLATLCLKKGEERRIKSGHPWIYSNEIDTAKTALKLFQPGQEVLIETYDKQLIGVGYVNPRSLIACRLISRSINDRLTVDFFKKRIAQALNLREQLFEQPFYRLIFSEADYLPGLIIDRFNQNYAVQINTAGMALKQDIIIEALRALLPVQSILYRNDTPAREQEGLAQMIEPAFGTPPQEVILQENSVSFAIPFWEGQKTGWFYDHRMTRARLKHYVKNKMVLDVFSYVGGWGIQAAAFGAKYVDCVETSQFACDYINKNAALNQVAPQVNTICEDAFTALKLLLQQNKQYDVIIVDPPAFVKRFKDRKEGLIAYQRINEMAVKLLASNGILISCSCSMHVSMEELIQLLQRIAFRTKTSLQLLERGHQGPDHPIHLFIPETDYLKAVIVKKT